MIVLEGLTVRNGPRFALEGIDLRVETGEYAALMGRTGGGKTTLLEAICGLRRCASGRVTLAGRDATRLKPAERGLGYVPQDGALFTTMTVRQNLAFALEVRRWTRADTARRVDELAETLGLRHLLDRPAHGLSGGETQRVALGRALAFHPPILLLDEPLSALDAQSRDEMRALLQEIRASEGATTLHITHDRAEADRLATRLFVLEDGKIRLDA